MCVCVCVVVDKQCVVGTGCAWWAEFTVREEMWSVHRYRQVTVCLGHWSLAFSLFLSVLMAIFPGEPWLANFIQAKDKLSFFGAKFFILFCFFCCLLFFLRYQFGEIKMMKKRSERHKHCPLAIIMWSQKFSPRCRPPSRGSWRQKFNQLETVTAFTYGPSLLKIDARNFELSR